MAELPDDMRWYHLDGTECVAGWLGSGPRLGQCTTGGGPVTPCPPVGEVRAGAVHSPYLRLLFDGAPLTEGIVMADTAEKTRYRYKVVETWGDVPEQITRILNSDEDVLLYDEHRGEESQQELWREGEGIVGGWAMEFVGEHHG